MIITSVKITSLDMTKEKEVSGIITLESLDVNVGFNFERYNNKFYSNVTTGVFSPVTYDLEFKNVEKEEMKAIKEILLTDETIILKFEYNQTPYIVQVTCEGIEDEFLGQFINRHNATFKLVTKGYFTKILTNKFTLSTPADVKTFDYTWDDIFLDLGNGSVGAFVCDVENKGQVEAFFRVEIEGTTTPMANPSFGLNDISVDTVFSYRSVGVTLSDKEILILDTHPDFLKLTQGGNDIVAKRDFLNSKTFFTLPKGNNKLIFTNVGVVSITMYEQYKYLI